MTFFSHPENLQTIKNSELFQRCKKNHNFVLRKMIDKRVNLTFYRFFLLIIKLHRQRPSCDGEEKDI